MKKLMTLIGALAMALGLLADTPSNYYSTSFEADDGGCSTGTAFDWSAAGWSFADGAENPALDAQVPLAQLPYAEGRVRRNTFFTMGSTNEKYAKLETGTNTLSHGIAAGQTYVDQLVKFTGFEEAQTTFDANAKIAVWMSAIESDDTADPAVVGETNLYVAVGTDTTTTNVKLDYAVQPDTWYRLTIKSLGNVNTSAGLGTQLGFQIFINGAPVAIVEDQRKYNGNNEQFTAAAKALYVNGQLFTSMTADGTVASVGYKGIGSVDDIIISQDAPDFDSYISFTVGLPTGVENWKVTCEGVELDLNDLKVLPNKTVRIFLRAADGYRLDLPLGYIEKTVTGATIDLTSDLQGKIVEGYAMRVTPGTPAVTNIYGQAELYAAIATVKNGDTVTFLKDSDITNGVDVTPLYQFTEGTTIAVPEAHKWVVNVPNALVNNDLKANVGIEAGKTVEVTFENAEYGTLYLKGTIAATANLDVKSGAQDVTSDGVTVAGTLKSVAMVMEGVITLVDNGKVITKGKFDDYGELQPLTAADFELGGETLEIIDGADGWKTYQIKAAPTAFTITIDPAIENGTVTTSPATEAEAGATVTVTATPATGYVLGTITTNGYEITGNTFVMPAENVTVGATFTKQGFKVIISGVETYFDTFAKAIEAASANDTIYILENASIAADAVTKAITVDIAAEKTLTVTGEAALSNALKVVGAGAIARTSALDVAASLNLAELAYAQTAGCTGGFNIKTAGIVYMPIGATYPKATLAVNTAASVDGAQIVVGGASGTTYTYGNGVWAQGTAIAVAKIGTQGYGTLAAAYAAAQAGNTIVLLQNANNADIASIDKNITLDLNGKTFTVNTSTTLAANDNITIVDNAATKGGLAIDGTIAVAAGKVVDIRSLNDGTTGLLVDHPGSVTIANGGEIKYPSGMDKYSANIMEKVSPNLVAAVVGGKVTFAKTYTKTATGWTFDGLVANAEVVYPFDQSVSYVEGFDSFAAALAAVKENGMVTLVADGTIDETAFKSIKRDITIDVNNQDVTIANAALTLTNDLTITCTGATANKGLLNKAQITIAAGKTLDLSELSWAAGLRGDDAPTATFKLGSGAIYKQGNALWDDQTLTIFSAAESSEKIKKTDDGVIKITTVATYNIAITTPENGTLETSVTNKVEAGETVTVTATPDTGYACTQITTNGTAITGNTFVMPAEAVTVAATFAKNVYLIRFISGEGTLTTNDYNVAHGAEVTAPTAATVVGKTFSAWDPEVVSPAVGAATYTAQYTINTYKITVQSVDNATVEVFTNDVATAAWTAAGEYTVPHGTKVVVTYTADEHYTIEGQKTKSYEVSVTGGATIPETKPVPAIDTFTITFNNDDATEYAVSNNVPYGTKFENVKPADPTKVGYSFTDWTPKGEDVVSNTLYTAAYTANVYTITYELNGGEVATANPTTYTIESEAITLNNPTKTGYTFAGWTGTGITEATNEVIIAKGSTGNRTYTANYTINKYTLTIPDVANATAVVSNGTAQAESPYSFDYNTTVKVYWTANAGYQITAGAVEEITMTENKTAASPTVAAIDYTITFGANGGSGTQDAITYTWGAAKTAPTCTFTAPENGTFNCWSNATTHATYAVGATLPTECVSYELVADWTIQAGPTPVVPGGSTDVKAKDAAEAISKVKVAVPQAAASVVDADVYDGYFTKTATEKSTGTWTVTATLKDDIVKASTETVEIASQLGTFTTGFSIDAAKVKAGLYYSLKAGSSVTGREEGNRVLAESGKALNLPAEKYTGSGFYQVLVNTAPKAE